MKRELQKWRTPEDLEHEALKELRAWAEFVKAHPKDEGAKECAEMIVDIADDCRRKITALELHPIREPSFWRRHFPKREPIWVRFDYFGKPGEWVKAQAVNGVYEAMWLGVHCFPLQLEPDGRGVAMLPLIRAHRHIWEGFRWRPRKRSETAADLEGKEGE